MTGARADQGGRGVRWQPAPNDDQSRWFDFLAAETSRRDGLLCFYDREKSPRVMSSIRVLARHLQARGAPPACPAPGKDPEDDPCLLFLPLTPGGPG